MSLKRADLVDMGIDEEKIDRIIKKHVETVTALNEKLDEAQKEAAKNGSAAKRLMEVEEELDALKKEDYKAKYESEKTAREKLKKEFDDHKAEEAKKAERAAKEAAFREILKDARIPEKHYAKIIKYSDIDGIELDDKGKAKAGKELLKSVESEWSEYSEETTVEGADTPKPPADNGGKTIKTKEEIMKISDTQERQAAIKEAIENGSTEFGV